MTLSSIDGQYRGPTPSIAFKPYIGDRCRLARISACVSALVCVMWHANCGPGNLGRERYENVSGTGLGGCASVREKSTDLLCTRGGVPVLSRPVGKPMR